jgi:hypothetical protein
MIGMTNYPDNDKIAKNGELNMKLKVLASCLLLVFALSLTSNTSADGVRKRIKFAKGKSAATISGAVIRGDRDTYIVGAREGQMISVKITSPENNAVFQVRDSNGEYLQDAGEEDDATDWSGDLPSTGDYEIIVGGTRGNASYKLTVSIE